MWMGSGWRFGRCHAMINHEEAPGLCKDMILCGFKASVKVHKPYDNSTGKTVNNCGTPTGLQIDKINV